MVIGRELPKISPEFSFVLNCTKYNTDQKKMSFLLPVNLDWDLVLRLAMAHGLFPVVYNALKDLDNSTVPKYVIKELQQNCIKNAVKVFAMSDEIVRICKSMDEHGVHALILKGSPISLKINEDIAFRPSNDIDILVDPLEFPKAEKILEQIGYKRFSPDFPLTPLQQKAYFNRYHHFEYFHSGRSTQVELHWRIRSFDVKHFPIASKLNSQKISLAGYLVPVMDDEHWLLFLMVHGYKHMWRRLRWLYDIKEFMKMDIDWIKVDIYANISGLRPIMHQTMILLNQLFEVPIPDCLKQSVAEDDKAWQLAFTAINNLPNYKFPPNNKNKNDLKHLYYFNLRSKWNNKLYFLFSLFKPGEFDFKLISLPYPLYYVIKPFNWFWRRIFKPMINVID